MRIFFWDFNDYNDIERQWSCFILNLAAFLFTLIALFKTIRHYKRIMFEMVPLTINLFATLVLLLLKLFQKGFEFDQIGYTIQMFTYFLFCYTFAVILLKVKQTPNTSQNSFQCRKKVCNGFLILFAVGLVVMSILIFSKTFSKNCDSDLFLPSLIGFCALFVSYFPTLYYGIKILRTLIKNQKQTISQTIASDQIHFKGSLADRYTLQRKRQVYLVLGAYTISLIIRGILLFISYEMQDSNYFQCFQCQGVFIVTSDYAIGQIILVFIQINQLIPHVVIPIAFYVLPVSKIRRNKTILLEQHLFDDDEDYDDNSDQIQSRVSSIITDKTAGSTLSKTSSRSGHNSK